jgi:two-component system, cell cycle sensor histidine kinase and response regulator CckA
MKTSSAAQTSHWANIRVREALAAGSNTELLKALVEAFPGSWFFTRLDATFAFVNQTACDSLGYTRDELMSLTLYDINPGLTPAIWNQLLGMGNFTPASVRTHHRRKDGSTYPVEAFGSRIVLGDENVSVSYVVDLSEEAQARQSLAEKQHLLQSLLDSAPVIVWSIDTDGRVQLLEGSALRQETGPVVGKSVAQQLPSLPEMAKATGRALQGASVEGIVTSEQHEFEYRYLPQRDGKGAVIGATGVAIDVTARRRAEYSNLRLMGAIEQADTAILLLDVHGRIEYANTAFERMWSTSKQQAVNHFLPDLLPEDEAQAKARPELVRAIATGTGWRGTIRLLRADSSECIQQATLSPLQGADARPTGFVAVSRDVTEQTQTEERLRQIEKMDAVGQLAGGVAHDFNNLLQVIMGNASLCLAETVPASVRTGLAEIRDAGKRAAALVRQLLTFSRHVGSPDRVDLADLVAQIVPLLRRLLGEHIAIDVQSRGDDLQVWGDASQLEQILVNLCVNARDAMPRGGRLTVRLSASDVPADQARQLALSGPGRYVLLEVEDTGSGMSEEVQRRAFEPFYTTKAPGVGTGLGLATVYGVAKRHGGSVDVQSTLGVGSCFRVRLRSSEGDEGAAQPVPHAVAQATRPLQILLAEDDPSVLEITRQFLVQAGHQVAVAKSGKEAIELIDKQDLRFDLVILDAIMPGSNGPEVFRRLRLGNSTPVLFVTGYDFDVLASLPPDQGWAVLRKPFDAGGLAAMIAKLVG